MHTSRARHILSATAAAALAITTFSAVPAFADAGHGSAGHEPGGHSLVRASLVGSMPAPASPVVAGINPGGAPWVNAPSSVRLREDGRITVRIRGLVIPPPVGTGVNPVASVVATLVCDLVVAGSTSPFALDAAGNGRTSGLVAVPRDCDDPMVLIQPAGNRTVYIASAMGGDHHGSHGDHHGSHGDGRDRS